MRTRGRFKIEIFLGKSTWSTNYAIEKNIIYSNSSTEWRLPNLDFTESNYGINLFQDEIDSAHAGKCFSNITITHCL